MGFDDFLAQLKDGSPKQTGAATGAVSSDDDAPLCLSKGETLSLGKKAPGLQKLLVGLGWDVNEDGGDFDLDACAFLLGENGKCARVKDVVFYGSLEHPSGAVKHLGDNRTGEGEGDDEQLVVDLDKAPESVARIAFTVSIHEAEKRGQSFGQVRNAFIRVVDEASGRELLRYALTSEFSDETALVVGELYRDGDDWQFRALGDGCRGGLAALCGQYGIKAS